MLELATISETTQPTKPTLGPSQRLEILSGLLTAVAAIHHESQGEAELAAEIALARLLRRDPQLTHFWLVVETLRSEIENAATNKDTVFRAVRAAPHGRAAAVLPTTH